jgi:lysozyme
MIDIDFIKKWEGCRLKAYKPLPKDKWTIGYGATGPTITEGIIWTQAQADADLAKRLLEIESQIERLAPNFTPNCPQMTALCSLVYNIGIGNFESSTLLKKIQNHHTAEDVASEFLRWNKSGGVVVQGLINRRTAEKSLYIS